MQARPITIDGKPLAEGRVPAICAPLVGRTHEALVAEAAAVAAKQPDLLEWRVDFFAGIGDERAVLATGAALRDAAGGIPLLFTRRSQREGGEPIAIGEAEVVQLYRAVCEAKFAGLVDFEIGSEAAHVREVRECSRANGVGLVLSFHDFRATPPLETLLARFEQAHALGADVAKVAVMPHSPGDVLQLLQAASVASGKLPIPVIAMSMGGLGAVSRLCGGVFGSSLTFAVGQSSSAPGQIPIDEVRSALAILAKASGS